jgi:hypothetical protein
MNEPSYMMGIGILCVCLGGVAGCGADSVESEDRVGVADSTYRVPDVTAEETLEKGASSPYAELALRGAGASAVEPACYVVVCVRGRCHIIQQPGLCM